MSNYAVAPPRGPAGKEVDRNPALSPLTLHKGKPIHYNNIDEVMYADGTVLAQCKVCDLTFPSVGHARNHLSYDHNKRKAPPGKRMPKKVKKVPVKSKARKVKVPMVEHPRTEPTPPVEAASPAMLDLIKENARLMAQLDEAKRRYRSAERRLARIARGE